MSAILSFLPLSLFSQLMIRDRLAATEFVPRGSTRAPSTKSYPVSRRNRIDNRDYLFRRAAPVRGGNEEARAPHHPQARRASSPCPRLDNFIAPRLTTRESIRLNVPRENMRFPSSFPSSPLGSTITRCHYSNDIEPIMHEGKCNPAVVIHEIVSHPTRPSPFRLCVGGLPLSTSRRLVRDNAHNLSSLGITIRGDSRGLTIIAAENESFMKETALRGNTSLIWQKNPLYVPSAPRKHSRRTTAFIVPLVLEHKASLFGDRLFLGDLVACSLFCSFFFFFLLYLRFITSHKSLILTCSAI